MWVESWKLQSAPNSKVRVQNLMIMPKAEMPAVKAVRHQSVHECGDPNATVCTTWSQVSSCILRCDILSLLYIATM